MTDKVEGIGPAGEAAFGWDAGPRGRALFVVALAFSTFQIVTAAFTPFSTMVVRAVHVGFLMLFGFALYPRFTFRGRPVPGLAWVLGAAGFALGLYQGVFEGDLIQRAGEPTRADLIVGTLLVVLLFEAARRILGGGLTLLAALFLAYALFGDHLPGQLAHRPFDFEQIVDQLSFGTEGIYGIPTYVSSTYIFLFILFGSFLEQAGMIKLFSDFALGLVGHTRGGPAKVAVVSSGLMGTINGSGIANVVTTGQFTIPLMKRFGYAPAFAGGVEATASMGGQIMPPVMGAVAFIMAETIGVPYATICKAAAIPAILYFASAFWMVHLEAGRRNLVGMPREECPDAWEAVKQGWYLLVPLLALIWLLFSGFTPLFSGTVGLALTAVLILGSPVARRLSSTARRVVFWILLGIACSGFMWWGIAALFGVALLTAVLSGFVRGGRETLAMSARALAEGARNALSVGVACAIVGIIIGVITLTGVATTFAGWVITFGSKSLFLSLLLTMLSSLVLGMGIPTIPTYIITTSLAAPALLNLGVPLIVSHMFVFYFGIMADLTPPVALAAFAAAPIAKESGMKIGFQAIRIALAGFVIPFMAVYDPALMLEGGTLLSTAYMVVKTLLAIGVWGAASIGYLWTPLRWPARALGALAAALLVAAVPLTDEFGFAASAVFIAWQLRARAKARARAGAGAEAVQA
ncbi:MAG TPA: TRAP transporter permease [Anaeromyxobacter sp.]